MFINNNKINHGSLKLSILGPLAVAGAVTGIAALFASLYSVGRVRKQLQLVERQTLFQRIQVYPILQIREKRFQKDVIYLRLKNAGRGSAVDIGLKVNALPLKPSGHAWDFLAHLSDFEEGHKKI